MKVADIPQIAELSVPEKILLVEDLWESIHSEESSVPIPQSHQNELNARLVKYRANPGNLLSLEQLRERTKSSMTL